MIHYSGWYYCRESNWGDYFDARNLVSIERYPKGYENEDYANLIKEKLHFDKERYEEMLETYKDKDKEVYSNTWAKIHSSKNSATLEEWVYRWLMENVKDNPNGEKGWCTGSKAYNAGDGQGLNLWFYRRKDALLFIKTWSIYKKPTESYNQNSYIKKKLNLDTNTLQVVENKK